MSTRGTAWQRDLADGARRLEDLVRAGRLDASERDALAAVEARYQFRVSRSYLDLIDWDDPHCPIRRQAIPNPAEMLALPIERADPIGDHAHRQPPAVVHRYPDRALLFVTLQCPMYCRYCFRKVYLADEAPIRLAHDVAQAMEYIERTPGIREVILSGGDPLLLATENLEPVLSRLRAVPHVRRIRIHSRVPATLPTRMDAELAGLLGRYQPLTVVCHFNHPRELSPLAQAGAAVLRTHGVPLANQAVLLRGVNDSVATLRTLFEGLLDQGIRPYYLHHPDLTVGTQHFRLSIDDGLALYRGLRGTTSGLAIPEYVVDIPGGRGKVPLDSPWVRATADRGIWQMTSPFGGTFVYVDPAVHPHGLPREVA